MSLLILMIVYKYILFRIGQEALNNIVKHANASNVEISLNRENEQIELRIKDDGIGF